MAWPCASSELYGSGWQLKQPLDLKPEILRACSLESSAKWQRVHAICGQVVAPIVIDAAAGDEVWFWNEYACIVLPPCGWHSAHSLVLGMPSALVVNVTPVPFGSNSLLK